MNGLEQATYISMNNNFVFLERVLCKQSNKVPYYIIQRYFNQLELGLFNANFSYTQEKIS